MNNLKVSLFFLTFTILFSCSKDDVSPTPPTERFPGIEGEWQLEEYYYENITTVSNKESSFPNNYNAVADDIDLKLEIKTEPNNWTIKGNYILNLSSMEDESVTKEIAIEGLSNNGNFSYDDYWFDPEEDPTGFPGFPNPKEVTPMNFSVFVIEDLSANRMELRISEQHVFTENGTPVKVLRSGSQIYKRL
ncbi:hypothetical protein LB465_03375 [Salegentibacter sp. LM13S]|uniref:hypothetical protein n=1 Tax=Salegentibacter lacus TaxID=2873599 RepID=UPI001CCCAC9D|nr:hypothetical protein [Salegentibacter lacus]MBZ9629809.1 hypothetical protein [Salegentibacter lacus]